MKYVKSEAVTLQTCPDIFDGEQAFDRITGICWGDKTVQISEDFPTAEYVVCMPDIMAQRIIKAATTLSQEKPGSLASYNCHRFARVMQGFHDRDLFAPLPHDVTDFPEVERLPMGAIGVYCSSGRYPVLHSLVGLGETSADALQVFSRNGEFGIGSIQAGISLYQSGRCSQIRLLQMTPGI